MTDVDTIMDTNKFADWIGLQTKTSRKCLNKQLSYWTDDPQTLYSLSSRFRRFKEAFKADETFYPKCQEYFKEIAECETELHKLIHTNSDLEKESYNEILFFRPILKPLNFVPFFLTIWSFIRVYLLPGISFIVPFLIFIAPYIILKFAFGLPITLNRYMSILQSMISGNVGSIFNTDYSAPDTSFSLSPLKFMKQFGIIIATFIQGIIQPYWSYKHLKSIDDIVVQEGNIVLRFRDLYEKLQTTLNDHGFTFFKCPLPNIHNERDATARAILESSYFKIALKYVGSLEVIMSLANQSDIHPVSWVKTAGPIFRAKNTFDFQVDKLSRKTISVNFSKKRHSLLTGPNKGGKSTVLRALSISALLAHTYGCGLGHISLTPFNKMFVCLKPDDLPGSKSRFEREIEFTANTLKIDKPVLIFIDELYHSTNPPDALRSCEIYCSQLWKKPNIVSVISTHLFELVEKADKSIQCICCPANIDEKGDIHFEYTLINGICKVSSVDELLKKNGLICARN